MSVYVEVPIGDLKVAEDNVRQDVGDVSELAASVKAGGVLQPLLVNEADMVVVAGARRLAAAKQAGLKVVPVMKRAFSDQERLETMIVENLQREDLTPLEEANALKRLVDLGLTQRQVAARVGRSQALVAKRLALLTLPATVQQAVDSGGITLPDAVELAKLKDTPDVVEKLAVKGNSYGPSISSKVEAELAKREKAKKRQAAHDALVKKGEKVLDAPTDEYGYRVQLPDGVLEVRKEAYTAAQVEMDPKAHAKLECHAVVVDPREPHGPIEVCTNPKSHPSRAEKMKAAREREAAKAKRAQEAFDRMTERRRDYVQVLIKGRADKDALLELAYHALSYGERMYYGAQEDEDEMAVELLRLEPPADATPEDVDWKLVLDQEAAKSVTARNRVMFAIAAATFEIALNRDGNWADEKPWFEWLVGRGYELSAQEKEAVGK